MATQRLTVLYDGDCGLCRACVNWLARRDLASLIECLPASTCTWEDLADLPLSDTVIARDQRGVTYLRSNAVAKSLSLLPGGWGRVGRFVLATNSFSSIQSMNDWLYQLIARNRLEVSRVLVRLRLLDEQCTV